MPAADRRGRPPDPTISGTATCPHVHSWPATWHYERMTIEGQYGSYVDTVRIVTPPNCPKCGERWDQVSETR